MQDFSDAGNFFSPNEVGLDDQYKLYKYLGHFDYRKTDWIYGNGVWCYRFADGTPACYIKGYWNGDQLMGPWSGDFDPTTEEKYVKPYEAELTKRIEYFNNIKGRTLTDAEESQLEECITAKNEISELREDHSTIYSMNAERKTSEKPYGQLSYAGKSDDLSGQSDSLTRVANIFTDKYDDYAFEQALNQQPSNENSIFSKNYTFKEVYFQ